MLQDDSKALLDVNYRDCLKGQIMASEEAQIRCPFDDGHYQCQNVITEREMRAVSIDVTDPPPSSVIIFIYTYITRYNVCIFSVFNEHVNIM